MERTAYRDLLRWKNSRFRKPLIIKGARQVGKTWLMKTFGQNEYRQVVYVNFEERKHLRSLFKPDFDLHRILMALRVATGISAEEPDTLIIFDEIQEAEEGITALKYFRENAPGLHVMAAGSYLGLQLHEKYSFPVGKVDMLDLYPLDFHEFLSALHQKDLLKILQNRQWELIRMFHARLIDLLMQYMITGGMPEAVKYFVETKDFEGTGKIQQQILAAYVYDFSKHIPARELPKINLIWEHIPSQLAKENKKFFFSHLKKGARAKEFETALTWLEQSGLIYKVYRVTRPGLPLAAYKDYKSFKVYFLDTGLLAAMSGLDYKTLLEGHSVFTEFKGALTEQFVLQQIVGKRPFYWSAEKSKGEVDFIVQSGNKVVPVEVKAGVNPKSKSLKVFCEKYGIDHAVRFSLLEYKKQDWLTNYPLYAAHKSLLERSDGGFL